MKHWDKYDLGGIFDVFDFDKKMALINLDMIYEYAVKLDTIVTEESNLEEWVKMKLTRIEQNVSDVAHSLEGWEKFDEGGMIFKKQLLSISKYAHKLIEMIKGGSKLMSWQENKLAVSANDIDNLYHHLDYKVGNRASQKKFATGGMMKYPDLSSETPIVINEPDNQKISEIDIALIDIALVRQDLGIEKTKIGSSNDAYQIFKQLWNKDSINVREEMNVLFLNNANEPIGYYEHTKGAINSTLVDVEMIAALALKTLSKGVILAHNHPSGNNKPSEADIKLYQQVKTALKMFNVTVLDSMILVPNSDNYYSLADNGYEMGGMVLSNKEIIKNIDFSDNTDRRLGRYDFSFETEDSEGASILDYDGYIIEAPSSSRMNDEIEWGQNVPEDWENAEKYILDEFYNWKLKRFKTGGGVDSYNLDNEINQLYKKSGFINSDFNWKLKLLEMLQDQSIEAYNIYKKLSKEQKEDVLQQQFEIDNDMGSYGDEDIKTSKQNLKIILEDAKNGKKYAKGGGVGEYKVGDTFIGTPNAKYDASWQLFKPSTSYVIDNKTNKIISIHNTPYDAIVERDNTNPNFKTHFKVYPKEHYKETGGGVDDKKLYEIVFEDVFSFAIAKREANLTNSQYNKALQQIKDKTIVVDRFNKSSGVHEQLRIKEIKPIFAKGGGVDYKIVAFPEAFMYKYFVVDEDNDNYLTVQADMFDKWKNASKIEKAEYYSEWIPKNEMVEVMAKGGGVGEILSGIDTKKYSVVTKNWGDIHIIPTSDNFWDEIKILLDKSNIKYTTERYDVGTEYFKIKDENKYAKGGGVGEIDMNDIEKQANFYTDESRWTTKPTIEKFDKEIMEYQDLKLQLDNNQIRPSKIIGTGFKPQYARALAYKWINERILVAKRAIEILIERQKQSKEGDISNLQKKIDYINKNYDGVTASKTYSDNRIQVVSPYFNTLNEIKRKEFEGSGLMERYGNTSSYVLYSNNIYEMGGGVSSELSEPQKEFSKSAEMLVRENLQNGEICMCKLKKILGHEPNYPKQVVGSLVLEKAYLRNFYKI